MSFLDTILENMAELFYATTFVVALWRYSKYYNTPLKYFPIIVIYTLLTEVLGGVVSKNSDLLSLPINKIYLNYNVIIYNIYNIIFFLYFFNLFKNYTTKKAHKNIITIGSILFIGISIVNMFIQNIFLENQIITYSTGSIFLVLIILNYLNQIDWHQNKTDPTKNILFWIGWGLLIFYSGYLPIKLSYHFRTITSLENYIWVRRLHLSLIGVMYSCFIWGFVKMRKNLKRE